MDRHDAKQFQPETGESTTRKIRRLFHLISQNLIHDNTDNLHALAIEKGLIESPFINGKADTARHNKQNLANEDSGHCGIGEIEYGPHTSMAAALDNGEVLFPTGPVK